MLNKLLEVLEYKHSRGYIAAKDFHSINSYKYVLLNAKERMKVIGAFGIWTQHRNNQQHFTPLVYIAAAKDKTEVNDIHKSVWNQSFVPYLLIITPLDIRVLNGFMYSPKHHNKSQRGEIEIIPLNELDNNSNNTLRNYSSRKLQSSLHWRDHAIDVSGKVDYSLLKNLGNLSTLLTIDSDFLYDRGLQTIKVHESNSLIGLMLYLSFLVDKGIVTKKWLSSNHPKLSYDGTAPWEAK